LAIGNLARDPRSAPSVKAREGSDEYGLCVGGRRVIREPRDAVMTVLEVQ
jgi:hypothetical protein